MSLISADTVVLEQGLCRPGWVETSAGRIMGCGSGLPPRQPDVDMPDALVVPGFVDIHVHGGGGASYTDGDDADILRAAMFHRGHGTTTSLASLVTAPPAELLTAVRALADSTRAGAVAGVHLEGPWLSAAHCGAHDPAHLRDAVPGEIDALLGTGGGAIRMVTLAPERAGSSDEDPEKDLREHRRSPRRMQTGEGRRYESVARQRIKHPALAEHLDEHNRRQTAERAE